MKASKSISIIITGILFCCGIMPCGGFGWLTSRANAQVSGYRWGKWSEGQRGNGTGSLVDKVVDSYIDSAGNTYIFGQFG